ncbi:AraC family transcriptional regulator [Tianweitania sediminis]|uniref:AraC family transcriptional regulator n=1 Tax=Tianweitania sediminis TaxID=1502156 RepID=A0A8J7R3H7_9HYPH|nr:AraC family transcriptional regulator [Tianweitania sediminis]MBP0441062.1 AraC family transcriptional regulator [Tianweitania sediminis]
MDKHIAELRDLIDRHARADMSTSISGVLLARHDVSAHEQTMSGTVMALVAQGAKRLALGERMYEYGPGQYLVASVDLPVSGRFVGASPDHPALGFGFLLEPTAIAELLLQAGPGGGRQGNRPPPSSMLVSDAPPALLDAVLRLLRLLDSPRDIAVLSPLIKREILWWLMVGEQGSAVRQLGLADSHLSHVSRAVRWIREHHAVSFKVEDVADFVGMSASAFYRNFKAVTAMSPIQFQKQIRLQEARLLLATHPNDVTGVGFKVGYDSASQFSREYRRYFGTAPSRDAQTLRSLRSVAADVED